MIPFDSITSAIRSTMQMRSPSARASAILDAARLDHLQQIEDLLRGHLIDAGMSPEAAAMSALSFVSKTAEHFGI